MNYLMGFNHLLFRSERRNVIPTFSSHKIVKITLSITPRNYYPIILSQPSHGLNVANTITIR